MPVEPLDQLTLNEGGKTNVSVDWLNETLKSASQAKTDDGQDDGAKHQ